MAGWKQRVRSALVGERPYSIPVHPNAIKLDANESPFPWSKEAMQEVAKVIAEEDLHRYPNPQADALRQLLSEQLGVSSTQLLLGNGSDELIAMLCSVFSEPRDDSGATVISKEGIVESRARASVLYPVPTFSVYRKVALAHGFTVTEVPLADGFVANEEQLFEMVARVRPNLIFLASPNNPTGTIWPRSVIAKLLVHFDDVITVIDEAYLAYSNGRSCIDLALTHPHCLVMQTLSKVGLAGLRVGYLIGRREVLEEIEKVRLPFNINSLSQRAAVTLMTHFRHELRQHVDEVTQERDLLAKALGEVPNVVVVPSGGNFLLLRIGSARRVYQSLVERGVIVRFVDVPPALGMPCLRVTIGSSEENAWFLDAFRASLKESELPKADSAPLAISHPTEHEAARATNETTDWSASGNKTPTALPPSDDSI